MKHHVKKRKFGKVRKVRTALLRSLIRALVLEERVETTEARAKEMRPFVEKLITRARNETLLNRRLVSSRMGNDLEVTKKLFDTIAPKYKDRAGGYTRITKLPQRSSDSAPMAIIEFV